MIQKLICGKIDWGSRMVSIAGNSLQKSIVYQATVTTEDSTPDENLRRTNWKHFQDSLREP